MLAGSPAPMTPEIRFTAPDIDTKIAALSSLEGARQISWQFNEWQGDERTGFAYVPVFSFIGRDRRTKKPVPMLASPCPAAGCSFIAKGQKTEGQLGGATNKHIDHKHTGKNRVDKVMSIRAPGQKASAPLTPRPPRRQARHRPRAAVKQAAEEESDIEMGEGENEQVHLDIELEQQPLSPQQLAPFVSEVDVTHQAPPAAQSWAAAWVPDLLTQIEFAESDGQDSSLVLKGSIVEAIPFIFTHKEQTAMWLDAAIAGPVVSTAPNNVLAPSGDPESPTTACLPVDATDLLPFLAIQQYDNLDDQLDALFLDGNMDESIGV